MARRASAIKNLSLNAQGILLILDSGDTLTGAWVSSQAKGQNMIEAMNAMGYDALGLGRMDTAIGLDALQEREAEARFAFLSANLVTTANNKPLFKPYTILDREGTRIGIIGLSDPTVGSRSSMSEHSTILDPTETARQYVNELRDQVDLLIVLSRLGLDPDKELAAAVPGIDIIVGGKSGRLMREPERAGNTLIVQQVYRGEYIGLLQATFDAQGVPSDYTETSVMLGPEWIDDTEMVNLHSKWNKLYPSPTPRPTRTPKPKG